MVADNLLTFVQTMNERAENCNQRMIAIDSFFFIFSLYLVHVSTQSPIHCVFFRPKNKPFDVEDQRDLF